MHKCNSRLVAALCLVASILLGGCCADRDRDGLKDSDEQALLLRFAPVFRIHDPALSKPTAGVGLPMNVEEFLQKHDQSPALSAEDMGSGKSNWRWNPGWAGVAGTDAGFYGRVWRPHWNPANPNIVSVQYYLFLSFNGRAANNHVEKLAGALSGDIDPNTGSHDGDWLCIDFGVDISKPNAPKIVHGIFHNHGRQIFVYPRVLTFEGERPVVFLEARSNEPWPNAGVGDDGRGRGWPNADGFALTERFIFHKGDMKVADENEICGPHEGKGLTHDPLQKAAREKRVRNIDVDDDPGCRIILLRKDPYGSFKHDGNVDLKVLGITIAGEVPIDGFSATVPSGPPFQGDGKMWLRHYNVGGKTYPFSEHTDPLNPPVNDVFTHDTEGGTELHKESFKP